MKIIGTRIRVEKSEHKTEYFPEYCLEEKTWLGFGSPKITWYGVGYDSPFHFGSAWCSVNLSGGLPHYSLEWAQKLIDYQAHYWAECVKEQEHLENREITYVKYP